MRNKDGTSLQTLQTVASVQQTNSLEDKFLTLTWDDNPKSPAQV